MYSKWSDEELELLKKLTKDGLCTKECGKVIGRSVHSIQGMKSRLGLVSPNISIIDKYSDEEFLEIYHDTSNISQLCEKLGYSKAAGHSRHKVKRRILKFNLPIKKQTSTISNSEKDPSKILTEDSKWANKKVRKIILDNDLLDYSCNDCGIGGNWNGKSLTLQIDHINGNNTDHRLENLRFLCPNCHTQTETYGSKNKRNNF